MASETAQAAMIDITVKTLDGQNRTFNVPEDFNVQQLKERISSSVEIPADKQRLIYQGRVMQDNQILKSYNIHGKVIHLVQRAPPTSSSTVDSATAPPASTARPQFQVDGNMLNVQINLGRVQGTPTTSEARARVRQAEFNLRIINDVLSQLGSLPTLPAEPTIEGGQESSSSGQGSRPVSSAATSNLSENRLDASGTDQPRPAGQETSDQQACLTAVELANFLDQVLDTQTRALSRIRQYQDLLRNEENYLPNSTEGQNAQEVVNRVTEILHAVGHMMHNLSDITVNMSTSVPRQAVAASLAPFQMPGAPGVAAPIQVNVRSRQDNRNRQRPRPTTTTTTSTSDSTNTATSTETAAQTTSAAPDLNTTTETTTQTSVSSTFQPIPLNITSSGDSRVTELYPTTVTVHDVTTIVTQGLGADSTSDSDSSSDSDSGETTTENRRRVTIRSSSDQPAAKSSASSKTTASAPSKTTSSASSKTTPSASSKPASSPPQRPGGGTTFTSSTSTSSTITFGSGMDLEGMHLPGSLPQMPQVPGLPSDFFQNIFGSLLNTGGTFPGRSVQVNVQEVTTSEETATGAEEQQQPPPNRTRPRSRERSNQQRSPTTEFPGRKNDASPSSRSRHAASSSAGKTSGSTTSASTSPASTTSTAPASTTSTAPASNTTPTSVPSSTSSSTRIPSQRANLGSRVPPNLGPHGRPIHVPRPYQFNLGPAGQARHQHGPPRPQQPESLLPLLLSHAHQGYVDPYLPCSSSQYMTQTAQAAARALPGQTRPQQQIPNLSAMVSGMVGEILGQASQQAANTAARANTANTPTSAAPSPSPAGATTTSAGSGQPTAVHNPLELLSHLLGATGGGAGHVGSEPAEFGAMVGSLMQAMTAPSATASTPTGNATTAAAPTLTMADFLSHVRSARNDGSTDTSVMNSILETIAPHIGLSDLFSLVMGNGQILSQVRQPLQELLKRLVSQHGSVNQVVEVVLNDFSTDIQYLQSLTVVKEGVDIARSVNNCLRTHLCLLFTDIHSGNAGPVGNFGVDLYTRWSRMMAELARLCVYCLHDGYPGFMSMLQRYISRITQDMNPAVTSWMAVPLQSIVESFYQNHPIPESDIISYVVSKPDTAAPTVPSSQYQSKPESKTSTTNVSDNLIHTSDSAVNHADLSGPTFPSTTESSDSQPPETPDVAEDSEAHKPLEAAQQSHAGRQPPATHPSTLATQVTHTTAGLGGAADVTSDEWHSVVPQDWIPVISQDTLRQQEQRPQPPFSDAYLQGLPAKRRRIMSLEHSRGMGNMLQYLPESIKRAAKTADVKPVSSDETVALEASENADLQAELEKEITGILEARINSDKDFSLDRFPNSEEYFHRSKQ